MYEKLIKRLLDFLLSFSAIIIFSPLLLTLVIIGSIAMKGNPFYTQKRPGKNEKIFKLLKFRTMNNAKDKKGNLLPDDVRLNKYGRFLRSTSLDELPELINILKGDMSIVGPRPLMARYLPYYTERERKRHSVRPGMTGYAQIHGRNELTWDDRFEFDLQYIDRITFLMDVYIILETVKIVFKREGIGMNGLGNLDDYRQRQLSSDDN